MPRIVARAVIARRSRAATSRGKRVVVVEDGPTLTHGGMTYGAGVVAAQRFGAAEVVDPRPYATGELAGDARRKYPDLQRLLPAMGYGDKQIHELEAALDGRPPPTSSWPPRRSTSRACSRSRKPVVRVRYELEPVSGDLVAPLAPVIKRAREAHALGS